MAKKDITKQYATCIGCKTKYQVSELQKIESKNKGYRYICEDCTTRLYGYCDENHTLAHEEKVRQMTLSFEYEQGSRCLESNILYDYGFIPTSDCTVYVEWKSPIYRSLCGIQKQLRTMEEFDDTDYSCGTHLNVGCNNREDVRIDLIRRHYNTLFLPLQAHMTQSAVNQNLIFGRQIGGQWARYIDTNYCEDHCNWVNVQHNTHLELRVAKFINAEQYMALIRWWTETVEWIVKEFNTKCTGNTTRQQDSKLAEKTALKLIAIFEKHFPTQH